MVRFRLKVESKRTLDGDTSGGELGDKSFYSI